jgi:3-oxoacyl-[acyl-carrier protein] reductase
MDLSLSNRRALVCGASAGIGRAIALELASLGATVFALARREAALQSLVADIAHRGGPQAHAIALDLDDAPRVQTKLDQLINEHGPVHILINNTGGPSSGPLLQADAEQFVTAFRRHVLMAQQIVRTLLPGMKSEGFGRIVNIVSTSVREPIPNLGVSNTIRGAMASFSKTLSRELPPGVTINNVLPGYTATERLETLAQASAERLGTSVEQVQQNWIATIPEGRLAEAQEIASVAAFLCTPAASYVRGVSLPVDGGRLQSI